MSAIDAVAVPLVDVAMRYRDGGLSVIATKQDKRSVGSWKQYQHTLATDEQIASKFTAPGAFGIAVICGAVSDGLEVMDFDDGGSAWQAWAAMVEEDCPGLLSRLPVETSPSGGSHVFYRLHSGAVPGNKKLAQRPDENGHPLCLIETRGEAGYVVIHPTPGYHLTQGDLAAIPVVTDEERDIMWGWALSLDAMPEKAISRPAGERGSVGEGGRPGDDFNRRGDVRELLQRHGWQYLRTTGPNEHWRRPGKTHGSLSATLREYDGVPLLYVFSSSTVFETDRAYTPFQVFTILEHGGDFAAAAGALRQLGYGDDRTGDVAACMAPERPTPYGEKAATPTGAPGKKVTFRDGAAMAREPDEMIDPVITDVLELGDKAVLIGAPKCRKSFFCLQLALSVTAGIDNLAFQVPKARRVAICQYEIREPHYRRRIKRTLKALDLTPEHLGERLRVASLRGTDATLDDIGASLEDFQPELIVLDPMYKMYKAGHDENRAGDAAALLAQIDRLAMKCNAATLVVHHDPKGASGDTKLTSRGAGSGVLARDYDASFILTPHIEEDDVIVLSTVLRNYADPEAMSLRWEENKFTPDLSLLPAPETAIAKAAKARRGPSTDELIESAKRMIGNAGGRMASVVLVDRLKSAFTVGRDKAYTTINLLEIEHHYRRIKDSASKKWYVTTPDFKPKLPEHPKLPGMGNQDVQEHAPGTSPTYSP